MPLTETLAPNSLSSPGGIRTSWLGGCPCRLNPYSKEPYFYHYMAHRLKTRVFIPHVHKHPHQVTTLPPLWTSTHWQHKVHIYLPNLKAGTMIIHAHAGITSSRQDKLFTLRRCRISLVGENRTTCFLCSSLLHGLVKFSQVKSRLIRRSLHGSHSIQS